MATRSSLGPRATDTPKAPDAASQAPRASSTRSFPPGRHSLRVGAWSPVLSPVRTSAAVFRQRNLKSLPGFVHRVRRNAISGARVMPSPRHRRDASAFHAVAGHRGRMRAMLLGPDFGSPLGTWPHCPALVQKPWCDVGPLMTFPVLCSFI